MSVTVDAKGLSCPQPVLLTIKALEKNAGAVVVEVDHETAAENVERACLEKGRAAKVVKTAAGYAVEVAAR